MIPRQTLTSRLDGTRGRAVPGGPLHTGRASPLVLLLGWASVFTLLTMYPRAVLSLLRNPIALDEVSERQRAVGQGGNSSYLLLILPIPSGPFPVVRFTARKTLPPKKRHRTRKRSPRRLPHPSPGLAHTPHLRAPSRTPVGHRPTASTAMQAILRRFPINQRPRHPPVRFRGGERGGASSMSLLSSLLLSRARC